MKERELSGRDLAYESIASDWEAFIDDFDTRRRLQVLVHELLTTEDIQGKRVLDGGCGLGYFSRELLQFGPAELVSVDIAPTLVARLQQHRLPGLRAVVGDLMDLGPALGSDQFDVVLSSEVIEHTPDPRRAFAQLAARVAPGGLLVLSAPNRRWKWLLCVAQALKVRKSYAGYENWVSPGELLAWTRQCGLVPVAKRGVHTMPWHLSKSLIEWLDGCLGGANYPVAVNLAILARRPGIRGD